jgi:hypothetical protein
MPNQNPEMSEAACINWKNKNRYKLSNKKKIYSFLDRFPSYYVHHSVSISNCEEFVTEVKTRYKTMGVVIAG